MSGNERIVGAQLAIRDSKLSRFTIGDIFDKIKAARELAGISLITIWPHFDREVNIEVIDFCRKLGIKVYLWYPVLADNDIVPETDEMTENAWGHIGRGDQGVWKGFGDSDDTYIFACPRYHSRYNRLLLNKFKKLLADYDGAVIENIRYPTPASGIEAVMSCFCPICSREEPRTAEWRRLILDMRRQFESATDRDLEKWDTVEGMFTHFGLSDFWRSKEDVIVELATQYANVAKDNGKEFALALLSPALTFLAAQVYERLTPLADWVRPLVLCRARCPSGLRVEITSMLKGMVAWSQSLTVPAIMDFFSRSTGLILPRDFYAVEEYGLSASLAFGEVARAIKLSKCQVYPEFEFMRENSDYRMDTRDKDVDTYCEAIKANKVGGFFMGWNLMFVPDDYLRLAGRV